MVCRRFLVAGLLAGVGFESPLRTALPVSLLPESSFFSRSCARSAADLATDQLLYLVKDRAVLASVVDAAAKSVPVVDTITNYGIEDFDAC